jgi:hypothetical protein
VKKLLMLGLVAVVATVAWFALPPPPRPDRETAGGHANHGGDPAALVGDPALLEALKPATA